MDAPHLTVSAPWLRDRLDDPGIVIVDCRFALTDPGWGRQQYDLVHIPGAYYLDLERDLSGPKGQHGGRHPLPAPDVLAVKLSEIGVNSTTLVVAYDSQRLAFAARLWWLLRYLGHDRVAVLDGGLPAWQAAGYPLTADPPAPRSGRFIPQPQPQLVVDRDYVLAHKDRPGVVLIDARERDRYLGIHEPIDPIAGHIPGAQNVPWLDATDADGMLRDGSSQWAAVRNATEIIAYCGSGVTACVNLLSLARAGILGGRLYAGSWSDWCSYTNP